MGPEERLAAGSRAPLSDGGGRPRGGVGPAGRAARAWTGSGWRPGCRTGAEGCGLRGVGRVGGGGGAAGRVASGGCDSGGGCPSGEGAVGGPGGAGGPRARPRRSCQVAWAGASLLVNLEFVGSFSTSSARSPVTWMFFRAEWGMSRW